MADTLVEPSTPAADPEESTSLSDHESTYGTGERRRGDPNPPPQPTREGAEDVDDDEPAAEPRDDKGRFAGNERRHRAQSQQATAKDVEAIAAHTKRLREAEDAIGIKQQAGESDRVYQLRRRAEIAELAKANGQAAAAPEVKQAPVAKPAAPAQPEAFTEPEPTQEQFLDKADPYGSFQRALAAWDRRKEAFDERQISAKATTEHEQKASQEAANKWVKDTESTHNTRMDAYVAAHPDAKEALQKIGEMPITPAIYWAVQLHEQGPAMMHALVDAPELIDELYLLTHGKELGYPATHPLGATVQRRLLARVQAAQTGSAASPRLPNRAPRPPNPVRTAPQTPSDALPDDESSLEAHEKAYQAPRRRK